MTGGCFSKCFFWFCDPCSRDHEFMELENSFEVQIPKDLENLSDEGVNLTVESCLTEDEDDASPLNRYQYNPYIDSIPKMNDVLPREMMYQANRESELNLTPDELRDSAKMREQCPESPLEERVRFLRAKKGNYTVALDQLQEYLQWRKEHNLIDNFPTRSLNEITSLTETLTEDSFHSCASSLNPEDQYDWESASRDALALTYTDHEQMIPLPRLARIDTIDGNDLVGKDNNKVIQIIPAQLDVSLASESTYALCLALYLDRKVSRTSMEQCIVCIDVRAGVGWPNPPAKSIVPFIKQVTKTLERNFPERLSKCIVYPLPRAATALWGLIKLFLDANTAKKVAVVGGPAAMDSPLPMARMEKYIDEEVLVAMERNRSTAFIHD